MTKDDALNQTSNADHQREVNVPIGEDHNWGTDMEVESLLHMDKLESCFDNL